MIFFFFFFHQRVFSSALDSYEKSFIIRETPMLCHHSSFPMEPLMAHMNCSHSKTTLDPWKHPGGFQIPLQQIVPLHSYGVRWINKGPRRVILSMNYLHPLAIFHLRLALFYACNF